MMNFALFPTGSYRLLIVVIIAFLLGGCISRPRTRSNMIEIAPNIVLEMPSPETLGYRLSASQMVLVEYKEEQHQLPVQLQVDENRLVLAGFSSWGSRIMSLIYEQEEISTSVMTGIGKTLPDPEQVLFNLMITLWPLEAWEEPMEAIGWRLEDTPKKRLLIDENQQVVVTILYEEEPPLDGKIIFMNHPLNLKITIKTLNYSR